MRGRAFLILMVVAGLLLPGPVAAEPAQRSVLVLEQSSAGLPFNTALASAIRSTINAGSKSPISFYSEHLDANRFFGPEYENEFVQFLKAKYRERHIDVVIVVGVSALDFIARRREQLWPSVPVVFAAIDEATMSRRTLPNNVTGATMQLTLQDMVKVARIVMPNLNAVAIVGDPLERQTSFRHFADEIPAVAAQLEIVNLMDLPLAELAKRLAVLPDNTAVIYTGIYFTSDGVSYIPAELTSQIAEWANRPVVVTASSYLNKGAIGGYIVQSNAIGQQAGRMALRILAGESASDIPVAKVPSQLIFEWPALQRWKISESRLPPGSEILFREPTVWERYSWQIALITAVILLQAGLISALLREHRRRKFSEVQSRQRMAELAHVNRFSTAGELTASIAHEINQPLGSILTNAETADAILKSPTPDIAELKDIVKDILQDDRRASEVIRRMRSLLTKAPFELKSLDLNDVARETVEFLSALAVARKVELISLITPDALPILGDRIQLQQVILNLVVNAIDAMADMPSENRIISIRTSRVEDFAELSVSDRGSGIPEDKLKEVFEPFFTSKAEGMGMGLSIARTIIEAHHGLISARNQVHGGASFRIRLPLERIAS
ncbi:MAG TPA: sensor histidine kinase [Bradyrhizobium sp.]|jgi:signal transduction histidine kinase|nr:sensor histidine kinase [Bradyrhizobium sp.]